MEEEQKVEQKEEPALASDGKRLKALVELVQEDIAAVLALPGASSVRADVPLNELGLDSLMAVELRNRLSARVGINLPTTLAFDYPTPTAMAHLLLEKLELEEEEEDHRGRSKLSRKSIAFEDSGAIREQQDTIAKAQSDALLLYAYLARQGGRSLPFSTVVLLRSEKIAKDPGAIERLFETLDSLAEAARPATLEGIQISRALAGEEAVSPAVKLAALRAAQTRSLLRWSGACLSILAGFFLAYVSIGRIILNNAYDAVSELTQLTQDWQKASPSSRPDRDLIVACISGPSPDLGSQPQLENLCGKTRAVGLRLFSADRSLRWWDPFNIRNIRFSDDDIVAGILSGGRSALELDGGVLSPVSALLISILFGALGVVLRSLRAFAAAEEAAAVTRNLPSQLITDVVVGVLAATGVGLLLGGSRTVLNAALAFLAGFTAPTIQVLLDRAIIGFRATLAGGLRPHALELLRPIHLGTHLIVGTGFMLLFLLGCTLIAGPGPVLKTLAPEFAKYDLAALPALAVIAGALGAWLHITKEVVTELARRRAGETPKVALPVMRYLGGALAGYVGGILVPSIIMAHESSMSTYNPFALTFIALASGYTFAYTTRSFVASVGEFSSALGASALADGVRRALAPPPLINYRGSVNAVLRRKPGLESCMDGEVAHLDSGVKECVLDVFFDVQPEEKAVSAVVRVEDGVDEAQALFDLEILADGFDPRRRRVQVVAERGRSKTEQLEYTVGSTAPGVPTKFRLTVSQAGRVVQFLSLTVRPAEELMPLARERSVREGD